MKMMMAAVMAASVLLPILAAPAALAGGRGDNNYRDNNRGDRQARERMMGDWCGRNRGDSDCRDWSRNRSSWNEGRYRDWYGRNRNDFRSNDGAAAIFGFAAGAVTGAIISGGANAGYSNTAACEARYRSYDPRTNTFLGYDGLRHPCRL